jgi:hypothetical protein
VGLSWARADEICGGWQAESGRSRIGSGSAFVIRIGTGLITADQGYRIGLGGEEIFSGRLYPDLDGAQLVRSCSCDY